MQRNAMQAVSALHPFIGQETPTEIWKKVMQRQTRLFENITDGASPTCADRAMPAADPCLGSYSREVAVRVIYCVVVL